MMEDEKETEEIGGSSECIILQYILHSQCILAYWHYGAQDIASIDENKFINVCSNHSYFRHFFRRFFSVLMQRSDIEFHSFLALPTIESENMGLKKYGH